MCNFLEGNIRYKIVNILISRNILSLFFLYLVSTCKPVYTSFQVDNEICKDKSLNPIKLCNLYKNETPPRTE